MQLIELKTKFKKSKHKKYKEVYKIKDCHFVFILIFERSVQFIFNLVIFLM